MISSTDCKFSFLFYFTQIAERNLAKQQEEIEKRDEQEQMTEERLYLENYERKELQENQITKLRYQQQLDLQMQDRQRERERLFQQFLEDKKLIDEAVAKIQRENEEAFIQKLSLKMATKQQVVLIIKFLVPCTSSFHDHL